MVIFFLDLLILFSFVDLKKEKKKKKKKKKALVQFHESW